MKRDILSSTNDHRASEFFYWPLLQDREELDLSSSSKKRDVHVTKDAVASVPESNAVSTQCSELKKRKKKKKTPFFKMSQSCYLCPMDQGCSVLMAIICDHTICAGCVDRMNLTCVIKGCAAPLSITVSELHELKLKPSSWNTTIPRKCRACGHRRWYRCDLCSHTRTNIGHYIGNPLPVNEFSFPPKLTLKSRHLYEIAFHDGLRFSKNPLWGCVGPSVETTRLCAKCLDLSRCDRCRRVALNTRSICAQSHHKYCESCIKELPSFFGQKRNAKEFLSVSGYNKNACNRVGGPYCWHCFIFGILL